MKKVMNVQKLINELEKVNSREAYVFIKGKNGEIFPVFELGDLFEYKSGILDNSESIVFTDLLLSIR